MKGRQQGPKNKSHVQQPRAEQRPIAAQTPDIIDIPDSTAAEIQASSLLAVPDRTLPPLAHQLRDMCVEMTPDEENDLRYFLELKEPRDDPYNTIPIATSGKTDILS